MSFVSSVNILTASVDREVREREVLVDYQRDEFVCHSHRDLRIFVFESDGKRDRGIVLKRLSDLNRLDLEALAHQVENSPGLC